MLNLNMPIFIIAGVVSFIFGLFYLIFTIKKKNTVQIIVAAITFVSGPFIFYFIYSTVLLPVQRYETLQKKLEETGVPIVATISRLEETNIRIGGKPQIKAELKFEFNEKTYEKEIKLTTPSSDVSKLQPGSKYVILINPDNPSELSFVKYEIYSEYIKKQKIDLEFPRI